MLTTCAKCRIYPRLSYHSYCKLCHANTVKASYQKTGRRSTKRDPVKRAAWRREYDRKRYAENLERIVHYKLDKGCADCGYRSNADALEFDHLPGCQKHGSPSEFATRGWKHVLAEIEKCEVVCSNCHSIRTAIRKRNIGFPSRVESNE